MKPEAKRTAIEAIAFYILLILAAPFMMLYYCYKSM